MCDGFTGNITLKASEGVASTIFTLMKTQLENLSLQRLVHFLMRKKGLKKLKNKGGLCRIWRVLLWLGIWMCIHLPMEK